jgi:hypothetical protein
VFVYIVKLDNTDLLYVVMSRRWLRGEHRARARTRDPTQGVKRKPLITTAASAQSSAEYRGPRCPRPLAVGVEMTRRSGEKARACGINSRHG